MKTTIFVGADRVSNREIGRGLGLKGEALDYFAYAAYEVELFYEVDKTTGAVTFIGAKDGSILVGQEA